ncbi:hypothetical protein N9W17_00820 [Jannaschia sp.]|nr:hypothetical protein [Jannaschia sp.]
MTIQNPCDPSGYGPTGRQFCIPFLDFSSSAAARGLQNARGTRSL